MRASGSPQKKESWRTLVRWPVFLLANVALLLIVGVSTGREMYRGWTVDREIHALEAQAASLEGRKLQLETLTQDLLSGDRIEYEARARLGKKKPGERVIVLEGLAASGTWSYSLDREPEQEGVPHDDQRMRSNPQRWWDYFFSSSPKNI